MGKLAAGSLLLLYLVGEAKAWITVEQGPKTQGAKRGRRDCTMHSNLSRSQWLKKERRQKLRESTAVPLPVVPGELFRFGLISDVQYADVPNGYGYSGRARFYRNALAVLKRAASEWERESISFGVHLGDSIDGICPPGESTAALRKFLDSCSVFTGKTHHIIGNHCLYNHPRAYLMEQLGIESPEEGCAYYSFSHEGFRFIMLDGYDVSAEGWPEGHPKRECALSLLEKINPNANQNSPVGLHGLNQRFVRFNGSVGQRQLHWLRETLTEAETAGEKVVVFSHQPLYPETTNPTCLLWNYAVVLALLWEKPPGLVVACFAGHAHRGGFAKDAHGIHHQVIEACLEAPPDLDAHAIVSVCADKLVVTGRGMVQSTQMPFTPLIKSVAGSQETHVGPGPVG